MNVLLMAYECSPYRGSEWAVGWGRVLQAAREFDVHVITSESSYAALTEVRSAGLLPANVTFHTPEPDTKLQELEKKPALFAYNYTAYNHWQKLAYELAKTLHHEYRFALVHQVNVCTFREPGYAWQMPIPFLWGPVGGSQNFPVRFLRTLPKVEALKEGLRSISNWISLRYKWRVRAAARAAAAIYAANSTNQRDYQAAFDRPVELLLETGLRSVSEPDRTRFERRVAAQREGRVQAPLEILWSGELQTRKALPILLSALSGVQTAFRLRVLGDGPQRKLWEAEMQRRGLAGRVTFLGRLPFAEAVAQMNTAELFAFTSLRDTSGNVILEAMAAGVPVVTFGHQGAGDMVDDGSGVRVRVRHPKQAVDDFCAAIDGLAADADKLLELSQGATNRARDFLWDRNGDRVNAKYRELAQVNSSSRVEE